MHTQLLNLTSPSGRYVYMLSTSQLLPMRNASWTQQPAQLTFNSFSSQQHSWPQFDLTSDHRPPPQVTPGPIGSTTPMPFCLSDLLIVFVIGLHPHSFLAPEIPIRSPFTSSEHGLLNVHVSKDTKSRAARRSHENTVSEHTTLF